MVLEGLLLLRVLLLSQVQRLPTCSQYSALKVISCPLGPTWCSEGSTTRLVGVPILPFCVF